MNAVVIDAIQSGRLAAWAAETPDHPLAARAHTTCGRIGRELAAERDRLRAILADAGVPTESRDSVDGAQRRIITLRVAPGDVEQATAVLALEGYDRRHTWRAGAERSCRAVSSELHLDRSDREATTVVRLRWGEPHRGRLSRLLTPTPADWAFVALPGPLWWAYPLVRVVRLSAERLGLRSRDHGHLEPFLVTPASLIGPVLDTAGVGAEDVVFDFGCGDGRFLIEAVVRRGCRAIGVEQSAERVAAARRLVAAQALSDRIVVERGDAAASSLNEVTVVVLFVPMVVARRVLPGLLQRARPGTRIVLHEQSALPEGVPAPARSVPIVTHDAVTVAHCWSV